jgi:hypothetical protein
MDHELDELMRSFASIQADHLKEDQPAFLYHYTKWDGFCGIMNDQRFWATDHRDTNDKDELQSADEIIVSTARQLQQRNRRGSIPALDKFVEKYAETRIRDRLPVYLTCFSTTSDNQDLWGREYAGSNGVCLGIRLLDEKTPEEYEGSVDFFFRRVRYSEDEWKAEVETVFKRVCAEYFRYGKAHRGHHVPIQAHIETHITLSYLAAVAACSAKLSKWEKEAEWRYIAIRGRESRHEPEVRNRSDGSEVRFLRVKVREQPNRIALSEVRLGPECEHGVAEVEAILTEAGYTNEERPPIITLRKQA